MLIGLAFRPCDALHGTARRAPWRFVTGGLPIVASRVRPGAAVPTVHPSTNRSRNAKEATMNTRTAPRLIAFFSAAFLTLVTLASINTLATSEPSAAQMARAAAMQQA